VSSDRGDIYLSKTSALSPGAHSCGFIVQQHPFPRIEIGEKQRDRIEEIENSPAKSRAFVLAEKRNRSPKKKQ
jgi:hypothetical protein